MTVHRGSRPRPDPFDGRRDQLGPDLAQRMAGAGVMEQVIISTALVMAIWCGGKLLVLARRDW